MVKDFRHIETAEKGTPALQDMLCVVSISAIQKLQYVYEPYSIKSVMGEDYYLFMVLHVMFV